MSIQSLYSGPTQFIAGASSLNISPIVEISEGYNIGGSIEYIRTGSFVVETLSIEDSANSRVLLAANSYLQNGEKRGPVFPTEFKSSFRRRYSFNAPEDGMRFLRDFRYSYEGVTIGEGQSRLMMLLQNESSVSEIILQPNEPIADVRVLSIMRRNSLVTVTDLITYVRGTDLDNSHRIRYSGGQVIYENVWGGSVSTVSTASGVSVAADADYYMMTSINGDRIVHAGSTDGIRYTKHIDSPVYFPSNNNHRNLAGVIGIAAQGLSSGIAGVRGLFVQELGDQQSYETAQRHLLATGGIFDVRVEKTLDGFSNMVSNSGSSWVMGASGTISRVSSLSGASWDTFLTTGNTFNDFILECDLLTPVGTSSISAGLAFGSTSTFYVYHQQFSNGVSEGLEFYNNGRNIINFTGTHLNLHSGVKYSMKLVKRGLDVGWYVNNKEISSVWGASLPSADISGASLRIGIAVANNVGASVSISNLRVSVLDQPVSSFVTGSNSKAVNMASRFLPSGVVRIPNDDATEIFTVGASRGEISNQSLFQSYQSLDNFKEAAAFVFAGGDRLGIYLGNTSPHVTGRFNYGNIGFVNDSEITNISEAREFSRRFLSMENFDRLRISINTDANPTLQQYDRVSLIDPTLGVSKTLRVGDLSKSYSASKGEFTMNLTLVDLS